MFSFFRKKLSIQELSELIVDECREENWFIIEFSELFIIDGFIHQIWNTLDDISISVHKAIVNNYLISNNYLQKLALKRKQLRYVDYYGDLIEEDWEREVQNFVKSKYNYILNEFIENTPNLLEKELRKVNKLEEYRSLDYVYLYIMLKVESYSEVESVDSSNEDTTDDITDGYQYELVTKEMFALLDWETLVTPKSGDQGADLIIEKYGLKFVVQCKFYNNPVGNKAVQEVIAAKGFYDAWGAIVVTNSDYTKSARQLAESHGVILLHDSQILEWSQLVDDEISQN